MVLMNFGMINNPFDININKDNIVYDNYYYYYLI